jgi:hypothetical protein
VQDFQHALLNSDGRGEARSALSRVGQRYAAIVQAEKTMLELQQLFQALDANRLGPGSGGGEWWGESSTHAREPEARKSADGPCDRERKECAQVEVVMLRNMCCDRFSDCDHHSGLGLELRDRRTL